MSDNIEFSKVVLNAERLLQLNDFSNEAILANERLLALMPMADDALNRIARGYIKSGRIDVAERLGTPCRRVFRCIGRGAWYPSP
jgi:hypothetical protein